MSRIATRFTPGEIVKFVLLHSLGNFLVLLSLYGVAATFGPAVYYEAQYQVLQARNVQFLVRHPQEVAAAETKTQSVVEEQPTFTDVLAGEQEQIMTTNDTDFSLLIPKIGATSKVFPNVDPAKADEFLPILQQGVAHAKGSVFPGLPGTTYLFAHSTDNWWNVGRYNAVFYLLKNLTPGDEIVVFFEDKEYRYVVTETFVAEPTDVELLANSQTSKEQLVLQTCWPPGTTWKRLFVVAEPK